MGSHTLTNHSLHPGQTDAVLILEQFAYGTDTAVAQMIDVVIISKAILQMHIIIDGSDDIFLGHMLGHKLMHILLDGLCQFLRIIRKFFQYLSQHGIINFLLDSEVMWIAVHKAGKINHHIGQNLDILLLRLDIYERNCRILNGICQRHIHFGALFRKHLSRRRIHYVRCQDMTADSVP